jgi:FKBP-type peptidyl-prolyl cis-trans isomerase
MKISLVAATIIVFLAYCSKEESSLPYEEQLAKDVALIDTYLAENGIDAKKDPSGFRYVVSEKGNDNLKPFLVDSIKVNYSLKYLSDQKVFTNLVSTFLLSKLIKAWKTALPQYGENSKITLYVPSGLAYGAYPAETTKGTIPKNSNLIFDIELVKVIREFTGQLQKDGASIDAMFTKKDSVITDGSGVRYKITSKGITNGLIVLSTDSVTVNYAGKILSNGVIFDQPKNPTGFRLNNSTTPKSWQKVFPSFKEGTKATLYVPSGLGYGAYGTTIGTSVVPPYANLVYDVELVKVIRK